MCLNQLVLIWLLFRAIVIVIGHLCGTGQRSNDVESFSVLTYVVLNGCSLGLESAGYQILHCLPLITNCDGGIYIQCLTITTAIVLVITIKITMVMTMLCDFFSLEGSNENFPARK